MRPFFLLLTLPGLLFACDPDKDGELSDLLDRDNDGFPESEDCDDLDAQVHPDAVEICDNVDNNCDGEVDGADAFDAPPWFVDADGDGFGQDGDFIYACEQPQGYVADRTDCNDAAITAYPGAAEVCDDTDNDCDGETDEGTALDATTWYRDGDGDGYGAALATWQSCDQPEGYVEDDTDCNDAEPAVNPGATEVCNEVDDDCDTLVDDFDPGVEPETAYAVDADGDLYGDEGAEAEYFCIQPLGYVTYDRALDCDDANSVVNPDQAELCADDIDNDCDGAVDEPDAPNLLAWYRDTDGDGYGDDSSSPVYSCTAVSGRASNAEDCYDLDADINPEAEETWYDGVDQDCDELSDYDADQDGFDSDDYGGDDCEDSEQLANPSLAEVCGDGLDNDCNGESDPCGLAASLYGESEGDLLGTSVAGGGDLNGDGNADVVIGAPFHNGTLITDVVAVGAAYVVYGPVSGTYSIASVYDGKVEGAAEQDQLGTSVAIIPDIDGDGRDELLTGAYGVDGGGVTSGAAYLFHGPVSDVLSANDADATLVGEVFEDRAGASVGSAGDVNRDGTADLIIGAYNGGLSYDAKTGSYIDAGYAYLVHGPVSGELDLSFADSRFIGENAGDWAGFSVDGAGDVNGDGYDDVVIGAPFARPEGAYTGAAYVVFGPPDDGDVVLTDADRVYYGINSGDTAGISVSGAGDINGDGRDDVLVGAQNNGAGGVDSGAAYLVSGSASSGSLSGALAILVGEDRDDSAGSSVDAAGDVDEDGTPDVLIGARRDDYTDSNAGGAYVLFGPLVGTIDLSQSEGKVIGEAAEDFMGVSVAGAGDTDSDGASDFVVGAKGSDGNGTDAGAAYIIRGGGW